MTHIDIQKKLREFGLKKSEIKVYLYLLEQGVSTPPQIARATGIARTNTYNILQSLKDKRLVEEQAKGKRKAYFASDPQVLVISEQHKQQALEQLLPTLRGLHATQKNKPKIIYFDGWDELKNIFLMTLEAKEVRGFASTNKLFANSPGFFEKYNAELVKKQIQFYDIVTHESGSHAVRVAKQRMGRLYEVKVLPAQYEDLPTDILIWNDNIALMTTEEPIFATVLTDKNLARTFKIMFELMWGALN